MPFLSPNQQCQSAEGKISHSKDLFTPNLPGDLPTLSLTTNSSWILWGRVAMPWGLPALWCQYQYIEDIFIQHLFTCLLANAHKTHWSDFTESFTRDMLWTRKLLLNFQNYWYLSLDLGIFGRNFYTSGIGAVQWNFADSSRSCCFTTMLLQLCGLDLILLSTTVSKLF